MGNRKFFIFINAQSVAVIQDRTIFQNIISKRFKALTKFAWFFWAAGDFKFLVSKRMHARGKS